MGYYTKFRIDCHIKDEAPESFKDALNQLVNVRAWSDWDNGTYPPAFTLERARTPEGEAYLTDQRYAFMGNPEDECLGEKGPWFFTDGRLRVCTDVKDYDGVIDKFWAWITPWIVEPAGTEIGACKGDDPDVPSPVIVGMKELEFGAFVD
jgi:hypothetical protein